MTVSFTAGGPDAIADTLRTQGWHREIERLLAAPGSPFEDKAPDFDRLTINPAFKTVFLTLEDFASGAEDPRPARTAWRHLLRLEGEPVAQVEADSEHQPIAVHLGTARHGVARAIDVAEGLDGQFEAYAIESPALKFYGLRAISRDADVIIPYEPNATPLPNYEPIPAADAMAQLKDDAEKLQKHIAASEEGMAG